MVKPIILLVDNDEDYLDMFRTSLETNQFEVIPASDSAEARRLLEKGHVDLAVIDVRLSNDNDERDISGLDLAREIHQSIPKIIWSSYPSYEVAREALRHSSKGSPVASDVISKQEGISALVESVAALLDKTRINNADVSSGPLYKSELVSVPQRTLNVFLCHSSNDKPQVRELYDRLQANGLEPWLDEKNLLPGQEWELEIVKAVRGSDVVITCLSLESVSKRGFVQKEIRIALDVADEQPEGSIFIIPLKLEECNIPERLKRWHWVNYFENGGYERLLESLSYRANEIGAAISKLKIPKGR